VGDVWKRILVYNSPFEGGMGDVINEINTPLAPLKGGKDPGNGN
jgi:hypothetical protein